METITKNVSILKIYIAYGQKVKGQSFWRNMWDNNLGQLLLRRAKEMGIAQAAIFSARAGYLENGKISYNISEIPPSQNPICLELVDISEKLQAYLLNNKSILSNANVILMNNSSFQLVNEN